MVLVKFFPSVWVSFTRLYFSCCLQCNTPHVTSLVRSLFVGNISAFHFNTYWISRFCVVSLQYSTGTVRSSKSIVRRIKGVFHDYNKPSLTAINNGCFIHLLHAFLKRSGNIDADVAGSTTKDNDVFTSVYSLVCCLRRASLGVSSTQDRL